MAVTAEERAKQLRACCMEMLQGAIDRCPHGREDEVFGPALWMVGALMFPDVVNMRRPDGQEYEYVPGPGGTEGHMFGIPVKLVAGSDRLWLATGGPS